jgi:hypothetical protein
MLGHEWQHIYKDKLCIYVCVAIHIYFILPYTLYTLYTASYYYICYTFILIRTYSYPTYSYSYLYVIHLYGRTRLWYIVV